MMKVLYTRSKKRKLSKAIMWMTGEDVSHVALQYGKWVIHSNHRGLNVEYIESFKKASTIVRAVEIPREEEHLFALLSEHEHSSYDLAGLVYFGFYIAMQCIGLRTAAFNLWGSRGKYTCVEWVSFFVLGKEHGLLTPHQFYLKLKELGYPDARID